MIDKRLRLFINFECLNFIVLFRFLIVFSVNTTYIELEKYQQNYKKTQATFSLYFVHVFSESTNHKEPVKILHMSEIRHI